MDAYIEPDFSAAALVTIDTQRDTLDGQPFEIPGTSAALPAIARLLGAFRESGRPIVRVVRIYKADGSNADLCRRAALAGGARLFLEGDTGCELAQALLPEGGIRLDVQLLLEGGIQRLSQQETIIYKPRWGAFYRTPLEAHLRAQGVNTLVFAGCNFPNCPRTSIYEASERDFRIVLAEDAISGLYDRGRAEMKNIGVWVAETEEILKRLRKEGA